MKKYDYIFVGAGCAALSLLTRMMANGLLTGKHVLLIDREPKQKNDRTWCFWEKNPGFFETVVCSRWQHIWFHADNFSKQCDIAPYQYKMIRGIDFYQYCFNTIQQHAGIDILYGEITDLNCAGSILQFKLNDLAHTCTAPVVFNSIWKEAPVKQQQPVYLLQHFKGWIIETPNPFFTTDTATLMDFRVDQLHGTTFVYVLPLSASKALVEYTLFSEKILPAHLYNEGLIQYMQQHLQLKNYTVTEEEFGIIPMTNAAFPWYTNGMYHIGTAGGQTKASSGYTFQFIQKQSNAIIKKIKENTLNTRAKPGAVSKRFDFYDAVLLRVLAGKYTAGSEVFAHLFKKNSPQSIFQFLDNESSCITDLRIIQSLPALPFIKAAYKQLLHL